MADSYDLIVMGAGPAGENAAITAAFLGKRVAVIEREIVGGACINTGTVPSKTLRETAIALSGFRSRDLYGVDLSMRANCSIEDLLRHERNVKLCEREEIKNRLARFGIDLIHGTGSFKDANTVRVTREDGETLLRGDKIAIAVGSFPMRPAGIPFDHNHIHDSDELLDLYEVPKSLAVIGAGVIGSEYACMFAALGVKTWLIDGRDKLLPFLDAELSASLEKAMVRLGVEIIWNEKMEKCVQPTKDGNAVLTLSSGRTLEAAHVLVCAGRLARTGDLNAEAAGLVLADKGRVPVNEHFQTNVPNIYAFGDVIGFPALASTSSEQARVATCHMFEAQFNLSVSPILPTGIYTIPEVSSAGETEEELKKNGVEYIIGRADYDQTARGKIIGDKHGFLKLLFRKSDMKLLGVHCLGEVATEVVHTGVLAMMMDQGVQIFLRTCFNYPTLGELYKHAALNALAQEFGKSMQDDSLNP